MWHLWQEGDWHVGPWQPSGAGGPAPGQGPNVPRRLQGWRKRRRNPRRRARTHLEGLCLLPWARGYVSKFSPLGAQDVNACSLPAAPARLNAVLCSVLIGGWEDVPFPFLFEGFAILAWVLVYCLQMAVLSKMPGYCMDHLDWAFSRGTPWSCGSCGWDRTFCALGPSTLLCSVLIKCGHGCPFPSFMAYYENRVFVLLIKSFVGWGHESQLRSSKMLWTTPDNSVTCHKRVKPE